MNVAFFENRVFADAIKLSSSWIKVALNPMTGAIRENGHNDTQIPIRQHHLATEAGTGVLDLQAKDCQQPPEAMRKTQKRFSLRTSRKDSTLTTSSLWTSVLRKFENKCLILSW